MSPSKISPTPALVSSVSPVPAKLVFLLPFLLFVLSSANGQEEVNGDNWGPIFNVDFPDRQENIREITVPAQIISKRSFHQVRLCGDQLVNALKLACFSYRGKRSAEADEYHPFFPASIQSGDESERTGFSGRFKAISILQGLHQPHDRVRRGGLSQECCTKPCTIATLQTYCPEDDRKRRQDNGQGRILLK